MAKSYTQETFIKKSKEIFENKFDYNKVNYVNSQTKITLICNTCGQEFDVVPYAHLTSKGCPNCSGLMKWDTEKFIQKAKEVHGNKYDYSKTEYVNKRTNVIITCPIHGDFSQNPHNHISQKQGCPECGKRIAKDRFGDYKNSRKDINIFKNDIEKIFSGTCEVIGDYVNNKTKIELYCHKKGQNGKEHGRFYARPDCLIRGHGCPICGYKKSTGELEIISFLKSYYDGVIIERDRTVLDGKEIDIFLPDLKLGIEYNGLYWHSEKYSDRMSLKHKVDECENKGIKLINIFEDEWYNKQEICKSRLLNYINKTERIFARKCTIEEISNKTAREFIMKNHIQGCINAKCNIALKWNDEIVAVMTFGDLRINLGSKKKEGYYELLRFCNKLGVNVIGGASKLFKYFIRNYSPDCVISYADRRWSNGNLYEKIGFSMESITPPNYTYINGKSIERINRFSMRKSILKKKYGCPNEVSEKEFCRQNGYYRLYDCGNRKYIWKKEN